MVLAVATLLFHLSAIPQTVLSPAATVTTAHPSLSQSHNSENSQQPLALDGYDRSFSPLEPQGLIPAGLGRTEVAFVPGRSSLEIAPMAGSALAEIPAAAPVDPANPAFVEAVEPADARERDERRRQIWLTLSLAQHSAAALDAWSTRRAISSGRAHELDPFMRPFAGNASIYAAIQIGPFVTDYLSRRMMRSEHAWIRHAWWVPQVVGTAASFASGLNNLQFHN